jgi:O-antigen/teichoic acid export membrane protein
VLLDFGFSGQFSRNFSYVFSGAQQLEKEGLVVSEKTGAINYQLLKTLIRTSQVVYRIIGLLVLVIMFTLGTWYIYKVTNGFTLVDHSLIIWLLYGISVFFNIYYMYLNSLLTGKGAIAESRKALVYSRIIYICVAYVLLLLRFGLISLIVANLVAPFVQRFLSIKYFYKEDIKYELLKYKISSSELQKCFTIIWHNTKKMGLVMLGSVAITRSGLFFAGLYLSPKDVAAYGLMNQLVGIITGVSITMFLVHQPVFAKYKINNNLPNLLKDLSLTMGVFYLLFITFSIILVFGGNMALGLIKSNVFLPSPSMLVLFLVIMLLEQNHSLFSTIIVIGNNVPFVKAALISGFFIIAGIYIALSYLHFGLLGIIVVPGIVQLCYNNWRYPLVVCKELQVSFVKFIGLSFYESFQYCRRVISGFNRFFKERG